MAGRFGGWWRLAFVVAGMLILIGGPRHPGGTMMEMLGHPDWTLAHSLMTGGFVALGLGLFGLRGDATLSAPVRRALWWATLGAALQVVEMVLHTLANLDHANLMAGRATPILSTHLALAVLAYPAFAVAMIVFIVVTARERALGSPFIAWLGVIGALGHGIAAPLAVLTKVPWARHLFPLLVLLAVWMMLTALWPRRAAAPLAEPVAARS
ncbi:MAG: hypothetical protein ABIT71_14025 [Vicinamibacteraceae bacterium]